MMERVLGNEVKKKNDGGQVMQGKVCVVITGQIQIYFEDRQDILMEWVGNISLEWH